MKKFPINHMKIVVNFPGENGTVGRLLGQNQLDTIISPWDPEAIHA